jgi:pyridoxamine 5'-phosphate oxidase
MRHEYKKGVLEPNDLSSDPIKQFGAWYREAKELSSDANAMALATSDAQGRPSCRMVLLKDWDEKGFCFFTDYRSHKSSDLLERPEAAATFFWRDLERQVCIIGNVEQLSAQESDAYFATRPRGSQLSTWASKQDAPLASRAILEKQYSYYEEQFKGKDVTRPPYWGGFRLIVQRIEFWQGRENRLHDRFVYTQMPSGWRIERLSP